MSLWLLFSSLCFVWVGLPSCLPSHFEDVFSFACQIKLSCNTGPSVASNFCCGETEPRKLHTLLTSLVLFLRLHLTETTSAWPLRGRDQAQQKPNSPWWKLKAKKTQHSGTDRKPRVQETRAAKTNLAESSHGSVSDFERPR